MDEKSTDIDASDSEEVDISKLDMAAAVQAALFQDVAIRGPEWFKAAVQQKAAEAKSAPGAIGFEMNSPTAKREEDEKRRDREVGDMASAYQQLAQQQEELKAWQSQQHSFIGADLTGREWGQIGDELGKESRGRDWLLSYLMSKGETEEQARKKVDDLALAAQAMSKPPSQRTKEEEQAMRRVEADPASAKALEQYRDAKAAGFPPIAASTDAAMNTGQSQSVAERNEQLTSDFPSAPNMKRHYVEAQLATEPLDVKLPAALPAVTPTPAMAGLDI